MSEKNMIKKAYISMGCFWEAEALFDSLDGVIKTYVGYTGGSTLIPTYNSIGDHFESVEIYYYNNKINFENLLNVFEKNHNYTLRSKLLQYSSAIFYTDITQKELALKWKENKIKECNTEVLTIISPLEEFHYAEFYHQKYHLQLEPVIMQDLRCKFSTGKDLIASPICHKLNSYLAGYHSLEKLELEIEDFNLSPEAKKRLTSIVEGFNYK